MTFTVGHLLAEHEIPLLPDGAKYELRREYIQQGIIHGNFYSTTRTITFLPLDPEPLVGSVWRVPNEGTPLGNLFVRDEVTDSESWWDEGNAEWTDWATLNERGGTLIYRAEETT